MRLISDAVLEEIKFRNNIEDVISSYVTLKRAGSNMVGLCPFHSEKSPSFTVFNSTSNFYCFGCGAGGDVITFIEKAENLDYVGALEFLAKRAGISIPENEQENKDGVSKTRVLDMNREAAKYFHANLLDMAKYPEAMQYLNKRGLTLPHIKHFGLGYSPNEWDNLTNFLKNKGFTVQEITAGFLGAVSKNGHYYDYFRNRIIFPILDLNGNVIAFGGRVMDDSLPKYLNSSDTPAFKKSRNLFALNFAKSACADQMILCEGYMDVIALHCAGITNAIATLGTAITPEQARIMKRYTKSVVISYDSDEPGQRAADKAFRLLSQVGLDTKILKMEGAKDPDEYVKKFGPEKFLKLLKGSRTEFEFKFDNILKKYDLSHAEEKIKAANDASEFISGFYSSVEREVYIMNAAKSLEIPPDSLRNDVERKIKSAKRKEKKDETEHLIALSGGYGDRVNPDYVKNPKAAAAEEAILGLLLLHPEEIIKQNKEHTLIADDFQTAFNRKVYEAITQNVSDGVFEEVKLGSVFSPEEMGRIVKMKLRRSGLTENTTAVLKDCITRLKESKKSGNNIEDIADIIGNKRRKFNEQ